MAELNITTFMAGRPLIGGPILQYMFKDNTNKLQEHISKAPTLKSDSAFGTRGDATTKTSTHFRSVYDCENGTDERDAVLIIKEGGDVNALTDRTAKLAYENSASVWNFYKLAFNRESVDNKNLELVSFIHYDRGYDNAFWLNNAMYYGDGTDFHPLVNFLDVVGHELTHGVVENSLKLEYEFQSGALNESIADVFGVLCYQFTHKICAKDSDWLIAKGLFKSDDKLALRSMKNPGTAFPGDSQPKHMDQFFKTSRGNDNGGVHTNSGIPNYAFYLAATAAGGNAWETIGPVWYKALTQNGVHRFLQFKEFATFTVKAAGTYENIVRKAWADVGITDIIITL